MGTTRNTNWWPGGGTSGCGKEFIVLAQQT
jgi:hypothetical protein